MTRVYFDDQDLLLVPVPEGHELLFAGTLRATRDVELSALLAWNIVLPEG